MILSNLLIHSALDSRRLIIDPKPSPRHPTPGKSCPYDTHSVDLRLGNEIRIPDSGPFAYDLTQPGSQAEFSTKNSRKVEISSNSPFNLEPHKFVLGLTMERVELPIPSDGETCLAARIEGKSSRARFGLLVHFTAPTVHPGFRGTLTLEMINLGPVNIVLTPGIAIAQLIIEEVRGLPISNPSQFQDQSTPAGS